MNNLLLLADGPVKTTFEMGRIQYNYEWWIYGAVLLLILAPLMWIYRRDAQELPWILRIGLPLLRTAVLVGLLFVYLQPAGGASAKSMSTAARWCLSTRARAWALPIRTRRAAVREIAPAAGGRRAGR